MASKPMTDAEVFKDLDYMFNHGIPMREETYRRAIEWGRAWEAVEKLASCSRRSVEIGHDEDGWWTHIPNSGWQIATGDTPQQAVLAAVAKLT